MTNITESIDAIRLFASVTIGEHRFSSAQDALDELIRLKLIDTIGNNSDPRGKESNIARITYEGDSLQFMCENLLRYNLDSKETKRESIKLTMFSCGIFFKPKEVEISYRELLERMRTVGLVPCPQQVPLVLRLHFGNSPLVTADLAAKYKEPEAVVTTKPYSDCGMLISLSDASSMGRSYMFNYFRYAALPEFRYPKGQIFIARIL